MGMNNDQNVDTVFHILPVITLISNKIELNEIAAIAKEHIRKRKFKH